MRPRVGRLPGHVLLQEAVQALVAQVDLGGDGHEHGIELTIGQRRTQSAARPTRDDRRQSRPTPGLAQRVDRGEPRVARRLPQRAGHLVVAHREALEGAGPTAPRRGARAPEPGPAEQQVEPIERRQLGGTLGRAQHQTGWFGSLRGTCTAQVTPHLFPQRAGHADPGSDGCTFSSTLLSRPSCVNRDEW